jgi:hypothetical protein
LSRDGKWKQKPLARAVVSPIGMLAVQRRGFSASASHGARKWKRADLPGVREGPVVRISAISGPGMRSGFPLRVSSLGIPAALSFDELRPPGAIPNATRGAPPRWPISQTATERDPYESQGARRAPVDIQPLPPPVASGPPAGAYDARGPYSTAPRPEPRYEPRYDGGVEATRVPARELRRAAPLGPSRGLRAASVTGTVTITPNATLACPMVSALDQWIATAVQPSAMRWFGQPVIEIRQISAYSCRGMNGNPRARISEHAFGNALDIAAFMLADGRRITVKDGWRGGPAEQGFLRDVQSAACDRFTTVLAPGSNVFHYDHMHVDLMRRASGYQVCNPRAVAGDEIAARVRAQYAKQGRDPYATGSVDTRRQAHRPRAPPRSIQTKWGTSCPPSPGGRED